MRHRCKPAMLAATLLFAAPAFAVDPVAPSADNILWWMVDSTVDGDPDGDPVMVNDGGSSVNIVDFIASVAEGSAYGSDFDIAARVRVTGGDIATDTFLDLYLLDPDSNDFKLYVDEGFLGVTLNYIDDNGQWGAGVPSGTQAPTGAYFEGSPEYSFIVEIGAVCYDSGNPEWTTVASSSAVGYTSLSEYMSDSADVSPPSGRAWVPATYTAVPEPTSGLMMAFGLALLALRRRPTT